MTDRLAALNYSTHAIEDLQKALVSFRTQAPGSAKVYDKLIEMLQHSVKFILPNCCELLDPKDFRQAHMDIVKLPFPCVAFESPWIMEDGLTELGGVPQLPATKRIALCWEAGYTELTPGMNEFTDQFEDGGVLIVPIYYTPQAGLWTTSMGGAFLPYQTTVADLGTIGTLPATRIANEAFKQANIAGSKEFRCEPFVLSPEFFEQAVAVLGSRDKAWADIIMDTRDEVLTVISACSVLNCANVEMAHVPAPEKLNKRRAAKKKLPFYSYKVLQVKADKTTGRSTGEGHHASPRTHLRRGHLRRLKSRTVWVKPTMVNARKTHGIVEKDYAVG